MTAKNKKSVRIPHKVMEASLNQAKANMSMEDRRIKSNRRKPTTILGEAEGLIYGDRNKVYRHPTENFANIANLWNAYFKAIKVRPNVLPAIYSNNPGPDTIDFTINKIDVAYMNILQKIARGATNQEHEDTIRDIAGYAGCIERILKNK